MDTTATHKVAAQLVTELNSALVREHIEEEEAIQKISEPLAQAFLDTLVAAGFEVSAVGQGKLLTQNVQDFRVVGNGEKYRLVSVAISPQTDRDSDYAKRAHDWLDSLVYRLLVDMHTATRENLVMEAAHRIHESIPLAPIRLNQEGDFLEECPPTSRLRDFPKHTRETDFIIGPTVGLHKYCSGPLQQHRATATHDGLVCLACHQRFLFPREVKTYGELRMAFIEKIAHEERREREVQTHTGRLSSMTPT